MSTLRYLLTDNLDDPRKEGLPVFGVRGGTTGNQHWSFNVLTSEFLPLGDPWIAQANSTTSGARSGMLLDPNDCYSWSDYSDNAQGQLSTQSAGSDNWYQSLHNNDQYPMGMCHDCSPDGFYMTNQWVHHANGVKYGSGRFLINQVLPEGVRARRFFLLNGNYFHEAFSSATLDVYRDTYDFSSLRPTGFTSRTQARGTAGYNERTKTLVMTHGDATNTLTVTHFTGNVCLNHCDSLEQFFTGATVKAYDIAWTYDAQAQYDRTIVVGDNGVILMGHRDGNHLRGVVWDSTAETPTSTALNGVNGTTSYGLANGNQYYTKMQLSWDGNWAFIYQPYYYYGCGVCAYVVSTRDPNRYFTYLTTQTGGGGAIMPLGESGFAHFVGTNTDNSGTMYNQIQLKFAGTTGVADAYIPTGGGGTTVAVGGALTAAYDRIPFDFHYTTSYPRFFTINWWPINGKTSYEGTLGNG